MRKVVLGSMGRTDELDVWVGGAVSGDRRSGSNPGNRVRGGNEADNKVVAEGETNSAVFSHSDDKGMVLMV